MAFLRKEDGFTCIKSLLNDLNNLGSGLNIKRFGLGRREVLRWMVADLLVGANNHFVQLQVILP